ncbi:ribbon-helix-helix domain-containing protein [Synechococcus sp. HK05]|uniref:ribbon-helix-helix domain-containing protein n=1 Tax=Synechococcus sp. HK05 TaxID=2725975 RepID=UPI0034CD0F38
MPDQSESPTEYVRITIDLERDLLDWIDGLCKQTGFRSRGLIISQLIRELIDDPDKEIEISPSVSDGQASQHP